MAGVTKHIYERDIFDINVMWNNQLKQIKKVLPCGYTRDDVLQALKKYYPHEWTGVEYKKQYYDTKDSYLNKRLGMTRYNMLSAEQLLSKNQCYNNICSPHIRTRYVLEFDECICQNNADLLWKKRKSKIERIDNKISKAKANTQVVTPIFLNKIIGLYEKKSTSQKDKVYIIHELMKYYNPRIISFFFKLNDTELNMQLREIAFKHLQSFNYEPRLRRQKYMQVHTENKKKKEYLKKVYPYEYFSVAHNPDELEYRIQNGREQKLKTYDYFISHSSKDSHMVQQLIEYENSIGKNIFCDWINDSDYLKRNLICEATLKVIEWRLRQSNAVIFVKSENSMNSKWCSYELNFSHEINKDIFFIEIDSIDKGIFRISRYDENEFKDLNYKNISLK